MSPYRTGHASHRRRFSATPPCRGQPLHPSPESRMRHLRQPHSGDPQPRSIPPFPQTILSGPRQPVRSRFGRRGTVRSMPCGKWFRPALHAVRPRERRLPHPQHFSSPYRTPRLLAPRTSWHLKAVAYWLGWMRLPRRIDRQPRWRLLRRVAISPSPPSSLPSPAWYRIGSRPQVSRREEGMPQAYRQTTSPMPRAQTWHPPPAPW